MENDKMSRGWQLTINNPSDHDLEHDQIIKKLKKLKNLVYYCMCDEKGSTFHTHVFVRGKNGIRFSTIKKLFPEAHIEFQKGTCQQNVDYIKKEGKWEKDKKKETNFPDTFFEWGEMPVEQQGKRNDLDSLYEMIKAGYSNAEIIKADASFILSVDKIERARKTIREDQVKEQFRNLDIHYIWGESGVGKTRYVMEKYGYINVCKVSNYHNHPFDDYQGEKVLLFDEFRSQLPLSDMLQYLDGYPINLPARYGNRSALFETVYIVSNIPLNLQYLNIQNTDSNSFNALLRRITDCTYMSKNGVYTFDVFPGCYIPSSVEIERELTKNSKLASNIVVGSPQFDFDFSNFETILPS